MKFSNEHLTQIKNLFVLPDIVTNNPSEKIAELVDYLERSERKFIDHTRSVSPTVKGGAFEHAVTRYLLRQAFTEMQTNNLEQQNIENLSLILKLSETPVTAELLSISFVNADGSINRFNTYENLDVNWLSSVAYYTQLQRGDIKKYSFVVQQNTAGIKPVSFSGNDFIKIAVVGDWGSGSYTNADDVEPSVLVMNSITEHNPDYTIHLGDVYYSGTSTKDINPSLPNEEQNNFVNAWMLPDGRGFALNSNHEMYSGGYGLFQQALTSPKFSIQNGASYFALVADTWVLFGLDSAYYDTSPLFMDGAIIDSDQLNFIKNIDISGKKVIVMTHHNAIEENGTAKKTLWTNVSSALGVEPDFWYWGHTHNAIVYNDKAASGSTIARCVGHGAIPFTKAPELYQTNGNNNPEISYYAGQELPQQPNHGKIQLAKNGYAILTIALNSLTETFYDLNGNQVWTSSFKF